MSNSYPPKSKREVKDADRRIRQADRLARILRVLKLIQSRGRWTVGDIAGELECSERTVYRDLKVLEFAGVPHYTDSQDHCVRLRPDYQFPVLNLSDDELLGQSLATAITKAPGLNVNLGAKPVSEKIAATNEAADYFLREASELTKVLDLKLADHSQHHEMIRTMQWALLEGKQVMGHYKSPYEPRQVKLTLHPYRLCLIKSAWYLIARPTKAEHPITLRMARFRSLKTIDARADIPQHFDLKEYFGNAWAVYRGETSYKIALRFESDVADIVTETTWHHTQKVSRQADGTATLTFEIDGLNEIVRWVLGWAGRVKIVKPRELRELVIKHHQKALHLNSPQSPKLSFQIEDTP